MKMSDEKITRLENLFENLWDLAHELAEELELDAEEFDEASMPLYTLLYGAIDSKQGGMYKDVTITEEEVLDLKAKMFERLILLGVLNPDNFPQA
jgi:chaperone required for assembly of F1-ATPase